VFISTSPRYAMEALGMILITLLALFMLQQKSGGVTVIPVLGALAIGAQKLLPALQQSYGAINGIKGSRYMLKDVIDLLEQPLPDYASKSLPKSIAFQNGIHLKNICFKYHNDAPWIINNLDLNIKKGSRVGFIGATGSGKSTLLDIIMGLLEPTSGSIFVDNKAVTSKNLRSWHACIAHVPQDIFLTGNPNVTYFKSVFKRHTNFSMESIQQVFSGDLNFGKRINSTIKRTGDLISGITIEIDLPIIFFSIGSFVKYFPKSKARPNKVLIIVGFM
jgi:ABC-type multidrug transport system fused ATPase/permease subunit